MSTPLTADQRLFRDSTRDFLEHSVPLAKLRDASSAGAAGFDRGWWRRGAELGWTSLLVPESAGGGSISGLGVLDLMLVAREMGRRVAPGPLLPSCIVTATLAAAAPEHGDVLDGLLSGETVVAWAHAEPGGRWSADDMATRVTAAGGDLIVNGTKTAVEAGDVADYFLVSAVSDADPALLLVPSAAPGIERHELNSLDASRRFAEVEFSNVTVGQSALIGAPDSAAGLIERQLQLANVIQCAEIAGAVERVFEFTVQWADDRYSFGRALASYQALKHRFADLKMWLEAINATTDAAAKAVQDDAPDAAQLVSVAKSFVAGHAPAMLQDCVQLHGGIGLTWEHDLHLYLRRVSQDSTLVGTASDHRRRLATAIGL